MEGLIVKFKRPLRGRSHGQYREDIGSFDPSLKKVLTGELGCVTGEMGDCVPS